MKHRNEAEKITDAFLFGDNPWKDASRNYIENHYKGVLLAARMVEVLKEEDENTSLDEIIQRLDETYYHMLRTKGHEKYHSLMVSQLSDYVAELLEPYNSLPNAKDHISNHGNSKILKKSSNGNILQIGTESPCSFWYAYVTIANNSDFQSNLNNKTVSWYSSVISRDIDKAWEAFYNYFGSTRKCKVEQIGGNCTPKLDYGTLLVRCKYEYDKYGDLDNYDSIYYAIPHNYYHREYSLGFGQTKPEAICNLIKNDNISREAVAT